MVQRRGLGMPGHATMSSALSTPVMRQPQQRHESSGTHCARACWGTGSQHVTRGERDMLDKLLARYLLACLPPYGPIRWHGPDTNRCTTRVRRNAASPETRQVRWSSANCVLTKAGRRLPPYRVKANSIDPAQAAEDFVTGVIIKQYIAAELRLPGWNRA